MAVILLLFAVLGIAPLAIGLALATPGSRASVPLPILGSVLFCALAFNLIFFWQELWLVIPKAFTPGLHPVLFHNNHEWTGSAPTVELLQGCGALATLTFGLAATGLLAIGSRLSATARLFCFWMAFQGLSQSLTQLAIGAVVPGNDVGRALTYLGLSLVAHVGLALVTAVALALSGITLARLFPAAAQGEQVAASIGIKLILLAAILSVALIVPFRIPRTPVETSLIPLIVNIVGAGWTILGFALAGKDGSGDPVRAPLAWPALALVALLLIFQLILRPGIRF